MFTVIQNFLLDLWAGWITDFLTWFQSYVSNLFAASFKVEAYLSDSTILNTSTIQAVLGGMYGFMVLLLTVKLLWKGFKVYILWRDGESETPPGEMVAGAVMAMIVAIAFPLLYDIALSVIMELTDTLLELAGLPQLTSTDMGAESLWDSSLGTMENGLTMVVLLIVAAILWIILCCKLLYQGMELLVWRLGVPIAVVGLIDSDGGIWKPYLQMIFKAWISNLVQYFFVILGTRILASDVSYGMLWAIFSFMVAFKTPKLLSQFMVQKESRGMGHMASTVMMLARGFIAA